jgi:hypothetical protein
MEALPLEMRPIRLHRDFLIALRHLSKISTRELAISLLQTAIENRKTRPHVPKHDHLSLGDINSVIDQLKKNNTGIDVAIQNSSSSTPKGM